MSVYIANRSRWGETDMSNFISYYREKSILWNHKHEDYSNKAAREKALRDIAENMSMHGVNLSPTDVRTKINSIRAMYRRELVSTRKTEKDSTNRRPKWFWFKLVHEFLQDIPIYGKFLETKDTSAISIENNSTGSNPSDIDPLEFKQEIDSLSDGDDADTSVSGDSTIDTLMNKDLGKKSLKNVSTARITEQSKAKTTRSFKAKTTQARRKLPYSLPRGPSVPAKSPGNIVLLTPRTLNSDAGIEDEFDVFGRSIAVQLRRLPLKRATLLQSKIQYMVSEERVSFITEQKVNGVCKV